MTDRTKGIVLLTMLMRVIERDGAARWNRVGGQSHAWKLCQWVVSRYDVRDLWADVLQGFLRADLTFYDLKPYRRTG